MFYSFAETGTTIVSSTEVTCMLPRILDLGAHVAGHLDSPVLVRHGKQIL